MKLDNGTWLVGSVPARAILPAGIRLLALAVIRQAVDDATAPVPGWRGERGEWARERNAAQGWLAGADEDEPWFTVADLHPDVVRRRVRELQVGQGAAQAAMFKYLAISAAYAAMLANAAARRLAENEASSQGSAADETVLS